MNSKEIIRISLRECKDVLITLFFSALITYIFAGNYLFTNFSTAYKNLLYGFSIGYSLWKGNQFIGWLGNLYFPWKKNPKLTFTLNSIFSVIYTVLAIITINYLFLHFVFNINIFDNLGRWISQMVITFLISLVITTSFYLAYFFKWWRISAINEEKLKQEANQLRYDALKSQVNPHFLFNSLSV
ncbi:MAG TPA: hypothetical protein PLH91_11295, partial [Tenuifilaceae bacterium]|nr:hypothetical protein [Tenuifilaceae bacterium]